MTKSTEMCDGKTTVSARVNSAAVSVLKKYDIPVSDVIEAGIIYFLCLDDRDKVYYLLKNNTDVTDSSNYNLPVSSWVACIRDALGLDETADVKSEIKNFKIAAKWLPDRGAAKLNQLNLRKLSAREIIQKADDLVNTGQIQEALSYYDYALMLSKKTENPREIGRISLKVGDAYRTMGNFSLALAAYEGAEAQFSKEKNNLDIADLAYSRGICCQLWGRHKEAYGYFQNALDLYLTVNAWDYFDKTTTRMALSLDFLPQEDAVSICDQLVDMFNRKKLQLTKNNKNIAVQS